MAVTALYAKSGIQVPWLQKVMAIGAFEKLNRRTTDEIAMLVVRHGKTGLNGGHADCLDRRLKHVQLKCLCGPPMEVGR